MAGSDEERHSAHLMRSEHSTPGIAVLEAVALRSQSIQMREIFAHRASAGGFSAVEIREFFLNNELPTQHLDPAWIASLATVSALQNHQPQDTEFGIAALTWAAPRLSSGEQGKALKLLAELFYETGRFQELDALLLAHPRINAFFHGYIGVDVQNPHVRAGSDEQRWLEGFNRPFTERGLLPVRLRDENPRDENPEHDGDATVPFNRLTAVPPSGGGEHPLVTVILTSYRPVRADILQSVRSVLHQTWENLELLIVDDASPAQYHQVLHELEQLDDRVRVIPLETNGGTYAARNIGIAEARGEFITGQDADDWSHPQRLEMQVHQLLENPHCPGNQVNTVNMSEDLCRIRRGYHPFFLSPPTLMLRAEIMRALGGYLPARKGADNELRDRAAAYTGHRVEPIALPLIFMRILPDSLSRADFRAGWQHPARLSFWSAYKTWHRYAQPAQLVRSAAEPAPISIPPRLGNRPESLQRLDVVLMADWCSYGPVQAAALEEIRILRSAGLRIGVLHGEDLARATAAPRQYQRVIQEMINRGELADVLADEDFWQVGLVLIRSPQLLEFPPGGSAAFTAETVAVVAERGDYSAVDCAQRVAEFFGHRPLWLPGSQRIRDELATELPAEQIGPLYPTPCDPAPLRGRAPGRRNTRPVITRGPAVASQDWPKDPQLHELLWPTDGSADVRLIADADEATLSLDLDRLPTEWMTYDPAEISTGAALRSADFFIHFTDRENETEYDGDGDLLVLHALAAGCLVILPEPPERTPAPYGDAALYADPTEVPELVARYWNNAELYREQSRRAAAFRPLKSPADYLQLIGSLLPAGSPDARQLVPVESPAEKE